jgi:hypothetical protein
MREQDTRRCVVQFLHPGGESRPRPDGHCAWDSARLNHSRKFLSVPGRYVADLGEAPLKSGLQHEGTVRDGALAQAKARGTRLGRRATPLPRGLTAKMRSSRAKGATLQRIADRLNETGTPAPRGGAWRAQTVKRVVDA